ncbi:MAG: hypothetical protein ACFB51_01510 [Anaerolineae bacterium]
MADLAQQGPDEWAFGLEALSLMRDRVVDTGTKKRASVQRLVDEALAGLMDCSPQRITWETRGDLGAPQPDEQVLVIDGLGFPPEGEASTARLMDRAAALGWRHLVVYNWRGGRFAASGLGEESAGIRVDLYGDVGDYAASGLDVAEVHIHGDAQDQVGQIMRRGKLVIHGDVGQTFLYGAKGGAIYVRGSAAGRPQINAVGRPRAVINGTCLDYLAESFMAGAPLNGGGFVILNAVEIAEDGSLQPMETPYPGGNLLSLASGGAIYVRDPHHKLLEDQLNGSAFFTLTDADWALIEPYLRENERLFGITLDDLLTVDGQQRAPHAVYRKVAVAEANAVLVETENR